MSEESPTQAESADGAADGAPESAPDRSPGNEREGDGHYEVLARKYRPRDFSDLVGQEAMVRTLTNAFASGRIAHAFVLSGVRGVGKTTTARIIARALNCTGTDDTGGPTITPCGACDSCRSIAQDRHVDVLEMDAASRTGVDDIRELIEGVRYRPVSARYKVYIIDEVHMLSRNAFNALLKTLEEPPEHVKFIFATTEIRRVPVTVLSRCQRFDLRRIELEDLASDFARIAELEGASIAEAAIRLIARAADGSHRDGLSLLDQVIATGARSGAPIGEDELRDMLGLADRARGYDLLEGVMKGDVTAALAILEDDYRSGADPIVTLRDVLEIIHWLTRIKAVPAASERAEVAEIDRTRGKALAENLSMATLTRSWQMLLKGLQEAQSSPVPIQAVEMILIRLAYLSSLPSPAEAISSLADDNLSAVANPQAVPPVAPAEASPAAPQVVPEPSAPSEPPEPSAPSAFSEPPGPLGDEPPPIPADPPQAAQMGGAPPPKPVTMAAEPVPESALEFVPDAVPEHIPTPEPVNYEDLISFAEKLGAHVLRAQLINCVRLVHYEIGRIDLNLEPGTPREIVNDLVKFLNDNTERRWVVSLSKEPGADTLHQQAESIIAARKDEVSVHPMVQAIMETFPGAEIETVRDLTPPDPATVAPDDEIAFTEPEDET